MLPESLKELIQSRKAFLDKNFPEKEKDKLQKEHYRKLLTRFDLASLIFEPPIIRNRQFPQLIADIKRFLKNCLLKEDLSEHYHSILELAFTNKRGELKVEDHQIRRFYAKEESSTIDINKLLLYLEIPYENWGKYYFSKTEKGSNTTVLTPQELLKENNSNDHIEKINRLCGSWDAYIYVPKGTFTSHENDEAVIKLLFSTDGVDPLDRDGVIRLPVCIEKTQNEGSMLRIYCKGIKNHYYEGYGELFGNYIAWRLWKKANNSSPGKDLISLQMYVTLKMLESSKCIINTGCIWNQRADKAMLSVVLFYRSQNEYVKNNLPDVMLKNIRVISSKTKNKSTTQRINNFIEYVSRKGHPELAPKSFEIRNNVADLIKRNAGSKITIEYSRPRDYFDSLSDFFAKNAEGWQWVSFLLLQQATKTGPKGVIRIYKWGFEIDSNQKIIKVDREFEPGSPKLHYTGIVQYKEENLSIYFDSNGGYKHFSCNLRDQEIINNTENSKRRDSGNVENEQTPVCLRGKTSTLHNNEPCLINEILVYLKKEDFEDLRGNISIDEFSGLTFLEKEDKKYLLGILGND